MEGYPSQSFPKLVITVLDFSAVCVCEAYGCVQTLFRVLNESYFRVLFILITVK